jgi:uncharacterized membrane protein HdeD (DUF308 family)
MQGPLLCDGFYCLRSIKPAGRYWEFLFLRRKRRILHSAAADFKERTMTINQNEAERLGRALSGAIHQHWGVFLAEGIVLVLLGLIAIIVPPIATLAFTIIIGWVFLVSGILGLVTTFWMRSAPGFWWSLISAIIAIAAGVVLLLWPLSGVLSLTFVLIAFFVIEGVTSILYAIEHRNQLTGRWGWMLVSGIVDLILAGIIFAGLPGTAAWALGLLVGINMVFGGAALIAMALAARRPA